jgi:hypothetical protein
MECFTISIGVDCNSAQAQFAASPDDTDGDFTAICDQDFGEHGLPLNE